MQNSHTLLDSGQVFGWIDDDDVSSALEVVNVRGQCVVGRADGGRRVPQRIVQIVRDHVNLATDHFLIIFSCSLLVDPQA
jgi:hypothetical protein